MLHWLVGGVSVVSSMGTLLYSHYANSPTPYISTEDAALNIIHWLCNS